MLTITICASDMWNDGLNEFVSIPETILHLEHSLVAISKWESKWKKPFLVRDSKTVEETLDYVRCMTLDENVNPIIYRLISQDHLNEISEYIDDPMSATWFSKDDSKPSREIVTSELIYYWMCASQIPFECQYWHLNRLMALIRICSIKNQPSKKMGRKDIYNQNAALNRARRAKSRSKG